MTAAILAILAALVPFVIWLVKRETAKKDDPNTQRDDRNEQAAKEIIHDDEDSANQSLDDDLNRLHDLQGHSRGQEGDTPKGG